MNKLLVVIASVAVLSGAYVYSFGLPPAIAALVPLDTSSDASAASPARGGGPGGGGGRNSATTVVLAPLEQQSYALVLRTIGTATALHSVDVLASESGTVAEVMMAANASVEAGDVLVRLDDRSQQLALEIAEAERDQAQTTVNRYEALKASGNLTVTNVSLTEAEIALRLAEANVGLAKIALEDRVIRAPIAGQLGLSDIQVGDFISTNATIVSIDDSSTIMAEFEVPERSIGLLEIGKPVMIGTPTYTGRVFEGAVTGFDTQLDAVTRSATGRAEIDNTQGLLLSGMTFNVRMVDETAPLPVVPSTAITWDRTGAGIWISQEGRAARHPVTIRYREGDQVWIETDVPLGSDVVVEGASKLRAGAAVAAASTTGAKS
ncbi:efflux RND transporter periplasmic adaptor subunit [Pacificibacter marinus]|uniref:efflux RND transporter periplasmic adaptor subunit n=1 Tax=Pacificibacter marinus TaxID=658057 RepID=UPI001C06FC41|nr:efflux RND transporter periplasmic adaptor subunit [Pacificibacter marinus]MBU2865834.1 efflux RND transporter periplasmic adaptor subunit [Pacificibacter marinus]